MKTPGRMWVVGACLASLLLLIVCETAAGRPPARGPVFRPGPPAHAPAHGYRRKQVCGLEIVFDAGLGLYVVVGRTDVWYHEGHFYRLRGGVWEISLRADLWEPVGIEKLPPGLQVKARSIVKPNGVAKANGNGNPGDKGNGAVKSNATDNKAGANPGGNASNTTRANAGDNKGNGSSAGTGDKVAKPNADANSGKVAKPGTESSAGKPVSKPNNGGKAKPAGKGKK